MCLLSLLERFMLALSFFQSSVLVISKFSNQCFLLLPLFEWFDCTVYRYYSWKTVHIADKLQFCNQFCNCNFVSLGFGYFLFLSWKSKKNLICAAFRNFVTNNFFFLLTILYFLLAEFFFVFCASLYSIHFYTVRRRRFCKRWMCIKMRKVEINILKVSTHNSHKYFNSRDNYGKI